jgi:geranylgeranyl pyrophosphate synthase
MTTTIEGTQLTTRMLELVDGLDEPLRTPVRSLAARPGKHLRATLVRTCAGPGGDPRRVLDLGGGLDVLTGRTVAALAYGEMLDVERAFDTTLPIDDYLELAERKTGDLFRLSCLLGAVEAGRGASDVTALSSYGAGLGMAFQILDDCLDFGSAASGKPLGTDHLLGLFGAPTLFALAADSTGELAALLLAPGFAVDDMPTVRRLVVALGGLDQATELAHATYDRAVGHLAPLDPELSAALTALWQVRS